MFRSKTNSSHAYVFKMLTLLKNTVMTLDRSAKGHHDFVRLAVLTFYFSVNCSE